MESEIFWSTEFNDYRVPDEIFQAAGGYMPNGKIHWRTDRRIGIWADWMDQCDGYTKLN